MALFVGGCSVVWSVCRTVGQRWSGGMMLGRAYGGGLWWGVFGPHGGRDGHDIYKRGGAGVIVLKL